MIIDKIAINKENQKIHEYYYSSAREGMFDLFNNMKKEDMINTLFLPGYIGWSPKEGSGIFDPIDKLEGLSIQYYKMTSDLSIDINDLSNRIKKIENDKFAVLAVNYFGFVDLRIEDVADIVKQYSGWLIEDNAHGFFTYQYTEENFSDATFFSLHKMFPFSSGGSLIVKNNQLTSLKYNGSNISDIEYNPRKYNVRNIAQIRRENS
jgi:selenocysteine lyase/cysteine desulfurase